MEGVWEWGWRGTKCLGVTWENFVNRKKTPGPCCEMAGQ